MIAWDNKDNNSREKRLVALIGMAAMGLLVTSIALIGVAQFSIQQQGGERRGGGGSNLITITGTTSDERITISENNHRSEICTFAGVAVSGSGVTYLGPAGLCPDNEAYGWDISPNPDGIDTIYRLEGNAISTGGGNADRVRVDDGSETDNDVYSLDVNQFAIFDGPGDDRYNLVGDSVDAGESLGYSDSSGMDRVTFGDRE
ncbi:MAG: hypothetical protein M3243_06990 [Thermoproteota archaeon]|nr:hypothetical protein [Thermoproteota archaeon]MDQ3883785.1 hypothetical protein [Thermoproteota archaeon]